MKTKKTTIVMLVASAIVIIGVTGTFATSANASDKIDNKNSEYIESTIAEDVMLDITMKMETSIIVQMVVKHSLTKKNLTKSILRQK